MEWEWETYIVLLLRTRVGKEGSSCILGEDVDGVVDLQKEIDQLPPSRASPPPPPLPLTWIFIWSNTLSNSSLLLEIVFFSFPLGPRELLIL